MATKTEGRHDSEFLTAEAPGTISRDEVTVTVPASTTLDPGTVLGVISATGKYVPYDDSYSDGREDAAGVLFDALTNDDDAPADMDGVVINNTAEVRAADLAWGEGVDEAKGLADLAAKNIKAR